MATVPRYHMRTNQISFGKNDSLHKTVGSVECLLESQPHWKLPNGSWSGGGPFLCIKHTLDAQVGSSTTAQAPGGEPWSGHIGPAGASWSLPTPKGFASSQPSYESRVASLQPAFATGWARTRPGNPTANLGQFLIELRDFPSIPGMMFHGVGWKGVGRSIRQRKFYKGLPFRDIPKVARDRVAWYSKLGSEYLNYTFGWSPFVRDLRDIYNLMKNIDKQMAQIVKDNGKGIRRSTSLGDDTSVTGNSTSYNFPFVNVVGPAPVTPAGGRSVVSLTESTTIRRWYVAKYQYYIPDTSSWQWNAKARAALFGVLPTPSLLWEVLPWSWLIDWFGNMGDVISNASPNAVENLVARYSYIMEHRTVRSHSHVSTNWKPYNTPGGWNCSGGESSSSTTRTIESKCRAGGFPFGPGTSFNGLSTRQIGILAALGLSRG